MYFFGMCFILYYHYLLVTLRSSSTIFENASDKAKVSGSSVLWNTLALSRAASANDENA